MAASWNVLMAAYAHSGHVNLAKAVFDGMKSRNVVSWTCLMTCYANFSATMHLADTIFNKMPSTSAVTWSARLSAYARDGDVSAAERMLRAMPSRSLVACNTLLRSTSSQKQQPGGEGLALDLFYRVMPQHDMASWNAILGMYGRHERPGDAKGVFDSMPGRDVISWTSMLLAFAHARAFENVQSTYARMPGHDTTTWNALLRSHHKANTATSNSHAARLFEKMPEKDMASWNAILVVHACPQSIKTAVNLFNRMPQWDASSWTTIITGLSKSGHLDSARHFFEKMPVQDVVSCNTMAAAYSRDGRMAEAKLTFDKAPGRDLVSWNTLLAGYSHNGHTCHAWRTFQRMPCHDMMSQTSILVGLAHARGRLKEAEAVFGTSAEHDLVSCNAMIQAYALHGYVAQCRGVFDTMQRRDAATWTGMMAAYTDAGLWDSAHALLQSMTLDGEAEPDGATFSTVLASMTQRAMVEEVCQCFRSMVSDYSVQAGIQHYCCIVDVLGRGNHLEQAAELIRAISGAGEEDVAWTALLAACQLQGEPERATHAAEHLIAHLGGAVGYVLLSTTYRPP